MCMVWLYASVPLCSRCAWYDYIRQCPCVLDVRGMIKNVSALVFWMCMVWLYASVPLCSRCAWYVYNYTSVPLCFRCACYDYICQCPCVLDVHGMIIIIRQCPCVSTCAWYDNMRQCPCVLDVHGMIICVCALVFLVSMVRLYTSVPSCSRCAWYDYMRQCPYRTDPLLIISWQRAKIRGATPSVPLLSESSGHAL